MPEELISALPCRRQMIVMSLARTLLFALWAVGLVTWMPGA